MQKTIVPPLSLSDKKNKTYIKKNIKSYLGKNLVLIFGTLKIITKFFWRSKYGGNTIFRKGKKKD